MASHWAHSSSCDYPQFSGKQEDIIRGLMFGDGSLTFRDSDYNTRLSVTMIVKDLLNHLSTEFPNHDTRVNLHSTAENTAQKLVESGFSPETDVEDCHDSYIFRFTNPSLDMFTDWYEDEGLVWPDDVPMSPTTLKYWYCSDGTTNTSNSIRVSISSQKFESESGQKKARRYFEDTPVPEPSFSGHHMCWYGEEDVSEVLDYMGQPLPGFEYKWNIHG